MGGIVHPQEAFTHARTRIHTHRDFTSPPPAYLDGVVEGQNVHALAVGHVGAGGEGDEVAEADAEVLADHLMGGVGWGEWVGLGGLVV